MIDFLDCFEFTQNPLEMQRITRLVDFMFVFVYHISKFMV